MHISKGAANELVEEMNKLVFVKIKEELIKITERKNMLGKKTEEENKKEEINTQVFKEHGIEILPEKLELGGSVLPPSPSQGEGLGVRSIHPMLAQKMSIPVQTQIKKTEHTLENITKINTPNIPPKTDKPKIDPYREIPE
jgi:hypothetical protein